MLSEAQSHRKLVELTELLETEWDLTIDATGVVHDASSTCEQKPETCSNNTHQTVEDLMKTLTVCACVNPDVGENSIDAFLDIWDWVEGVREAVTRPTDSDILKLSVQISDIRYSLASLNLETEHSSVFENWISTWVRQAENKLQENQAQMYSKKMQEQLKTHVGVALTAEQVVKDVMVAPNLRGAFEPFGEKDSQVSGKLRACTFNTWARRRHLTNDREKLAKLIQDSISPLDEHQIDIHLLGDEAHRPFEKTDNVRTWLWQLIEQTVKARIEADLSSWEDSLCEALASWTGEDVLITVDYWELDRTTTGRLIQALGTCVAGTLNSVFVSKIPQELYDAHTQNTWSNTNQMQTQPLKEDDNEAVVELAGKMLDDLQMVDIDTLAKALELARNIAKQPN